MTDDLKIKQPQDPKTINTHQDHEMSYWSKTLGVSADKIKEIVREVGNSVDKVKDELYKRSKK